MSRPFGIVAAFASLPLAVTSWLADASAQGLPTPGLGAAPLPEADGGNLIAPMILLGVALLGTLVLAVAAIDLRRKRRAAAAIIEGQIADALMREPRLARAMLVPLARVPVAPRAAPTVEIRGEVGYPELRETAVRIVRQELLRHHPEGRVEDRIFVAPPIPAARG
jgi:hypothetical protein